MNTRTRGPQTTGNAPHSPTERSFRQSDIPDVRRFARQFGACARMAPGRLADFVLAASEAAACATARGPCIARVRLWTAGSRAFCEVRSDGTLARRGDVPQEEEAIRRWVLGRVSDYVSVASGPGGACVLLSMTVA